MLKTNLTKKQLIDLFCKKKSEGFDTLFSVVDSSKDAFKREKAIFFMELNEQKLKSWEKKRIVALIYSLGLFIKFGI